MRWKHLLFLASIIFFSTLIPLCHADTTMRRSSSFAYYLGDYGTKVKFNSDLYCTQLGWIDNDGNGEYDRIKFYNAYIGSGTARTFWISMQNGNLTVTSLLFGTSLAATVAGTTGVASVTTIGGLPSSPEHVRLDGAFHNEWAYSNSEVTVTVTHTTDSQKLFITWSPPAELGTSPGIFYPNIRGKFVGAKTFHPTLGDLLQHKTMLTVSFEVESLYYDGEVSLFYTVDCVSSDLTVCRGNQTVDIEPDMTKTVAVSFNVPCDWNMDSESYRVEVYTVVSGTESDTISRVVAVENSGDAVLQYKGLVLSGTLFLVGLSYYVWTSKKEKKVLGVKT